MLLIVDGSNMAFRAHCACPPLKDREGKQWGAVFGMLRILRSLVCCYPEAAHVVVVFDIARSPYRTALYPQYKAHRDAQPDRVNKAEYKRQLPYLISLLRLLMPVLTSDQMEADDAIAWLSVRAAPEPVVLSSTDRDLYQLVSDRVSVVDPWRKETATSNAQLEVTPHNFFNATGVKLAQYIDYRVLTGDSSDNIQGIPGVGPKTAAKLLSQYGSISNMLAAKVDKVCKAQELLKTSRDLMELTLHEKSPGIFSNFEVELCREFVPDYPTFNEALEALSFRSLLEDATWLTPFRDLARRPILNKRDSEKVDAVDPSSVPSVSSA